MKFILFAWLLITAAPAASQKDSIISYVEVVNVEGVSKNDLFSRGRQWFNEVFKSSKAVLQIADKESGELAGKGKIGVTFMAHYKWAGNMKSTIGINFICNIWVKEGKYKYEMTNFQPVGGIADEVALDILTTSDDWQRSWPAVTKKTMDEIYRKTKIELDKEVKELIASLKYKMITPSDSF